MGYTYYWYRKVEIPEGTYKKIVDDFKKTLPLYKVLDIKLCNGLGEGKPEINYNEVCFNGDAHAKRTEDVDVGIAWPAEHIKSGVAVKTSQVLDGSWFGGRLLKQRTCNGDCAHETFHFPRIAESSNPCNIPIREEKLDAKKRFLNFCKTAFKPYDLAVTVFLVIAKYYLKDNIMVHSDGELEHWKDAMNICQETFGYSQDFRIDRE